jgi:hypothetical protein
MGDVRQLFAARPAAVDLDSPLEVTMKRLVLGMLAGAMILAASGTVEAQLATLRNDPSLLAHVDNPGNTPLLLFLRGFFLFG